VEIRRTGQSLNSDASLSPTSLQIARRLIAREDPRGAPEKVGAALQRAVARVSQTLSESMGEDGYNALVVRALARTEADHPALKKVVRLNDGVHLDGIKASVEAHGAAAVTAAIEALLAALVDVLGRLMGEDMAVQIIDPDPSLSRKGGGAKAP